LDAECFDAIVNVREKRRNPFVQSFVKVIIDISSLPSTSSIEREKQNARNKKRIEREGEEKERRERENLWESAVDRIVDVKLKDWRSLEFDLLSCEVSKSLFGCCGEILRLSVCFDGI